MLIKYVLINRKHTENYKTCTWFNICVMDFDLHIIISIMNFN